MSVLLHIFLYIKKMHAHWNKLIETWGLNLYYYCLLTRQYFLVDGCICEDTTGTFYILFVTGLTCNSTDIYGLNTNSDWKWISYCHTNGILWKCVMYVTVLTMNKHICWQFIQMLVINTLTRMPCFLQLVVWPAMSSVLPPVECI